MNQPRLPAITTIALALLLGGACASRPPQVRTAALGERVTLGMTESVAVQPRGLVLQFSDVVADSRCPEGVTCVWEGDAEVSVRAVARDGRSRELRLHTAADRTATFGGVAVRLIELAPRPREGKPPRQADYELTLEVGAADR